MANSRRAGTVALSRLRARSQPRSGGDGQWNAPGRRQDHPRAARPIQRLLWRAPYVRSTDVSPDPVREIALSFYNGALYQVIVTYDRQRRRPDEQRRCRIAVRQLRTGGGRIGQNRFDVPSDGLPGSIAVARWQTADALLMLLRADDGLEFQLILESKAASASARRAIRESTRLDTLEAPRRDLERRTKEASDAEAERDKARMTNKAAFPPVTAARHDRIFAAPRRRLGHGYLPSGSSVDSESAASRSGRVRQLQLLPVGARGQICSEQADGPVAVGQRLADYGMRFHDDCELGHQLRLRLRLKTGVSAITVNQSLSLGYRTYQLLTLAAQL